MPGYFILYLSLLIFSESTRVPLTIDTSPGMKKSEEGLGAEFRWTLSKPFDTTYVGSSITIYKSVTSGTPVLLYKSGTGLGCNTYGDSSLSCITEGTQVGFGISDIETSDASRYSIQVDPGPGTNVEDSDAVLYIYRKCSCNKCCLNSTFDPVIN